VPSQPPADLVLVGGAVWPAAGGPSGATGVAIRAGRIVAVGDDALVLARAAPGSRRIDLGGGLVLPGLIDAHAHVRGLGERLSGLDLRGAAGPAEVADAVRRRAASGLPSGAWITGGGWDQNLWPGGRFPDHAALSAAAPGVPVVLRRVDCHAAWVNQAALAAAGVTRGTPDPPGGRVERDARGEPTGILIDTAIELVDRARPRPSRRALREWIALALARLAAVGLTGVHDAGVGADEEAAYRDLAGEDALPVRAYLMWDGTTSAPIEPLVARDPVVDPDGGLTVRAVKLMADGALGSRGALLFGDYRDAPGHRGLFVTEPGELGRRARLAHERGYQVAVHAIGDRGIRETLDALAPALAASPSSDPRPRIEHLQCVRRADLPVARRLGIIASMQPSHATSDMGWAEERVASDEEVGLYAWRWAADAGLPIAAGSDFPVDPEQPLYGLHAAVTRRDRAGRPEGGWHPEQRLTLAEAVRAYTEGAAYAAFEERERGRIAPGLRADLTILAEDLRVIAPERIHAVPVRATVVGGRVAYDAA
jgi:predicted amidohydrolase YtcJ